MKRAYFIVLALLFISCTANPNDKPMKVKDNAIKALNLLAGQDNFAREKGGIYTGVHDPVLKAMLNAKFNSAIKTFIKAINDGATKKQYIALLNTSISGFNRSLLDTEDAEHLATNFEKIMDCIGLESSGGALNNWMYGFEPK